MAKLYLGRSAELKNGIGLDFGPLDPLLRQRPYHADRSPKFLHTYVHPKDKQKKPTKLKMIFELNKSVIGLVYKVLERFISFLCPKIVAPPKSSRLPK